MSLKDLTETCRGMCQILGLLTARRQAWLNRQFIDGELEKKQAALALAEKGLHKAVVEEVNRMSREATDEQGNDGGVVEEAVRHYARVAEGGAADVRVRKTRNDEQTTGSGTLKTESLSLSLEPQ